MVNRFLVLFVNFPSKKTSINSMLFINPTSCIFAIQNAPWLSPPEVIFRPVARLQSELDYFEAAIIDDQFDLTKERCGFALKRDKLVYHKQGQALRAE